MGFLIVLFLQSMGAFFGIAFAVGVVFLLLPNAMKHKILDYLLQEAKGNG